MFEDFSIVIESFLVGAFPWVSQLKNLDIHFKIPSFNLKSIYNFFASLFSLSIYLYMNGLGVYEFIYWPDWKLFIGIAFILVLIYFIILIYRRNEVSSNIDKWPIILNFVIYIFIFCSLTSGFGLLKTYKDHYVIKGVIMSSDDKLLEESTIILEYKNDTNNNIITITDNRGDFSLLIPKNVSENYNKIAVIKTGYNDYEVQFGNVSALKSLSQRITLNKLNP